MTIKNTHPDYDSFTDAQKICLDSADGEIKIKSEGVIYLPATVGHYKDGFGVSANTLGQKAYDAYKLRAVYPPIFEETIEEVVGALHRKPPKIHLPPSMEILRERCTARGESLTSLLRRINALQLTTGRMGLLGDLTVGEPGEPVRPNLVLYEALAPRNWAVGDSTEKAGKLQFVVLDESGYVLQSDFSWVSEESYRVLALAQMTEGQMELVSHGGTYVTATGAADSQIEGLDYKAPSNFGTALSDIPFTFINSIDLAPTPSKPPLLGLALMCLAIYRGEADYRQNLFEQGQDTLVKIGGSNVVDPNATDETATGAGAVINVPLGGDAKFIGVSANGLSEQRESLSNDYSRAERKGGKLQDSTSNDKESGEALKIRVSAQTVTLPQIALTGAAGLQHVLRTMAPWFNANPEEIIIEPNLDFTDEKIDGDTFVDIMQAKGLGAPLSQYSIHTWLVEQGATKLSYEEELQRLTKETDLVDLDDEE